MLSEFHSQMKLDRTMFRQQTGSHYTIMISKPPRPPSWRDFVPADAPTPKPQPLPSAHKPMKASTPSTSSMKRSKDLEFSNLARIQQKSYSEGSDLSRLGIGHGGSQSNLHRHAAVGHSHTLPNPHTSKSGKRHHHHRSQGRLHRTTSQYNIEQADFPRIESMTVSLANTKLHKKGNQTFDPLIYLDDNTKRCERWLQEVQASQPLEDIGFTSTSTTTKTSAIQLNIPEEGLDVNELVKTPIDLCSGSGSEVDSVSVCAAHRLDLSDKEKEAHIRLPNSHPLLKSDNLTAHKSARLKSDLKDVIEESSSVFSSNFNSSRIKLTSKENRDPCTVSSGSEDAIQQRNNRKNLSDHSGSPRGSGYIEREGSGGNDVKLNLNR